MVATYNFGSVYVLVKLFVCQNKFISRSINP